MTACGTVKHVAQNPCDQKPFSAVLVECDDNQLLDMVAVADLILKIDSLYLLH